MLTFEDALENVRNEEPSTPTPEQTTGNEVAATTPTDDEIPQNVRDYVAKNPEAAQHLEELNRQFKSAFTPKLQEAAELRKRYEGINENTVEAIRYLQSLTPQEQAAYLKKQIELLEGPQGPEAVAQPANDPLSQYEPATEVEAYLLKQFQDMQAWRQQQEAQYQQIQTQQESTRIMQEFDKLQQELGTTIPLEARAAAWEVQRESGGKISASDAYFAQNRTTLIEQLTRKARDEASSIVQQKTGLSTPGGLVQHSANPVNEAQTFTDIFREMRGT